MPEKGQLGSAQTSQPLVKRLTTRIEEKEEKNKNISVKVGKQGSE